MKYLRRAILSAALVGVLASPAFAQGEPASSHDLQQGTLSMTTPTGRVVTRQADQAMAEMLAKDAMPMSGGEIMMLHNGKMYHIPDRVMPNGKLLSDVIMGK